MPTGELYDIGLKVVAGLASAILSAMVFWLYRRSRRTLRMAAAYDQLRFEKNATIDRLDDELTAWKGRYERLWAVDQVTRDRFIVLRNAYLAIREQAATPAPQSAHHLQAVFDRLHTAESASQAARDQVETSREVVQTLTTELEQARSETADLRLELEQARQKLDDNENRLADLVRFDGRLWLREPAIDVPKFVARDRRKPTIISVLNLKGGVGKTTLTANLAATFATPEAPALMIDLDYQRSLSQLLVGDKRRKELHGNGWTVQHFLRAASHSAKDMLGRLESLHTDVPNCYLLTNSDTPVGGDAAEGLEETENRLMVEWLVDRGSRDPRFLLREALHDADLDFGYVLLDCPPRLTTACINALAASDFVLIPTVPDSVSTHAVENLLYTLAEFRDQLLPGLAVLGVVPNMLRLRNEEPIDAHASALRELRDALTGVWTTEKLPIFKSVIKYDSAFGIAAAELDTKGKLRLAIRDAEVRDSFHALAREIEKEIRHASRRSATVPAKPGARARSGG